MDENERNALEEFAKEVLAYALSHPDAQDTPSGIADWWVSRERRSLSLIQVEWLLERLVAQGLLKHRGGLNGTKTYRLNPAMKEEAEDLIKGSDLLFLSPDVSSERRDV